MNDSWKPPGQLFVPPSPSRGLPDTIVAVGRNASYSDLWMASQGGPRYWLQLREIPEEQYVQSTEWSLSTVCSPFPAVTLPSYLADQDVQDSRELRGNHTDLVDENPTQTLPLRRLLVRVLGESSAVCLTHCDARPVVQSAAIYLAGHRILDGEANELHAMGPAAGSSQADQLIVDLRHHATNPPPATPKASLASAESAKR